MNYDFYFNRHHIVIRGNQIKFGDIDYNFQVCQKIRYTYTFGVETTDNSVFDTFKLQNQKFRNASVLKHYVIGPRHFFILDSDELLLITTGRSNCFEIGTLN
jgi:hypothetical protein